MYIAKGVVSEEMCDIAVIFDDKDMRDLYSQIVIGKKEKKGTVLDGEYIHSPSIKIILFSDKSQLFVIAPSQCVPNAIRGHRWSEIYTINDGTGDVYHMVYDNPSGALADLEFR